MHARRIFITGATGLAGAHILRHLYLSGYRNITALRRSSSPMDLVADIADDIEWVEGDLTDTGLLIDAMSGAEWVIHSAALISHKKGEREVMYETNAAGTANVVNAALENGVAKLLYISSIATMSRSGKNQRIDERTEWNSTPYTSYYGFTKYLGEMEVWRGNAEGLQTCMLNPSIIMGSGFWHQGSLRIVDRVAKGLRYYPVGGTGFVDVRDLAHLALLRLTNDGVPGRMLANGWNTSYKDLFTRFSQEFDRKPPTLRITPQLAEIAWRILKPVSVLTGREMTITRYTARVTSSTVEYDNTLSLQLPGFAYTPKETTIRDIARQYLKWQRDPSRALPLPFPGEPGEE